MVGALLSKDWESHGDLSTASKLPILTLSQFIRQLQPIKLRNGSSRRRYKVAVEWRQEGLLASGGVRHTISVRAEIKPPRGRARFGLSTRNLQGLEPQMQGISFGGRAGMVA